MPGLHISRKERKHMFAIVFFELSTYGFVVVTDASIDLSPEIFVIDIMTALRSSLKHRRKHVLRSLRLYGDQA